MSSYLLVDFVLCQVPGLIQVIPMVIKLRCNKMLPIGLHFLKIDFMRKCRFERKKQCLSCTNIIYVWICAKQCADYSVKNQELQVVGCSNFPPYTFTVELYLLICRVFDLPRQNGKSLYNKNIRKSCKNFFFQNAH